MNAEKINLHDDSQSDGANPDLYDLYKNAENDEVARLLSEKILNQRATNNQADQLTVVAKHKKERGEVNESKQLLDEAKRLRILGRLIERSIMSAGIDNFGNSRSDQSSNQNSIRQ